MAPKLEKFGFPTAKPSIALAVVVALLSPQGAAFAQSVTNSETIVPAIWVDPDGCEHWVFDDGVEGYMTPHLQRDGRPVCRSGNICGVLSSDQLFASDSANLSATRAGKLRDIFAGLRAKSVIIAGHTDSRASDAYNMRLSERRATAVAEVAVAAGVQIFDVRGYGERNPKASNRTASGRAKNRRVEIICVN